MPEAILSDYFYGDESEQFVFFKIPRQLITGTQKMDNPTEALAPVVPTKDGKVQETPGPKAGEEPAVPVAGDKPKEARLPLPPPRTARLRRAPIPKLERSPPPLSPGISPRRPRPPLPPLRTARLRRAPHPRLGRSPLLPSLGVNPKRPWPPLPPPRTARPRKLPVPSLERSLSHLLFPVLRRKVPPGPLSPRCSTSGFRPRTKRR